MSKIKNGGLDQYGAEPFELQQCGIAGVEGVNAGLSQRAEILQKMHEVHRRSGRPKIFSKNGR